MTDKERLDEVKRTLGDQKFSELAVLLLERKVEGMSPVEVKKQVKDKFGIDLGLFRSDAVFIKY